MFEKLRLNTVIGIIKTYKWKSTFFHYFKNVFSVLLIPTLLLTTGLLYFSNSSNVKTFKYENMQSVLKTKQSIENALVDVSKFNSLLINNHNICSFILTPSEKSNSQEAKLQQEYSQKTIQNFMNANESINSIYVYSFSNNFVVSNNTICNINQFSDKTWLDIYINTKKHLFAQITYPDDNHTSHTMLSFVYPLSYYNEQIDGLAIINVKLSTFGEYINARNSEKIFILDADKTIIYSNDTVSINKKYDSNIPDFENNATITKNNKIICYYEIDTYPFILVSENEQLYSVRKSKLIPIFILYILILIIIIVILSFMLSVKFYLSISDLMVSVGLSGIHIPESQNTNELQFIRDSILSSISEATIARDELYKKSDLLKTSQQLALQLQIAPHFLLNTLNTINLLLLNSSDNNKVIQINSLLAELLANILNTKQYIISINEEINYTRKYIEIEQYKSKNSFCAYWDINEECLNSNTVKFILQPIIENAIFHGIKKLKNKPGEIKISVKKSVNDIIFLIEDNGLGMNEDTFEKINDSIQKTVIPQNEHIGILNVNIRIQSIYGNKYGVKILKSDKNGTMVQIKIPFQY